MKVMQGESTKIKESKPRKKEKSASKHRAAKVTKKEDEENDLFELIGSYKQSEKIGFEYDEIKDQMDKVIQPLVEQKIQMSQNSEDPKPQNDYREMNSQNVDWRQGSFQFEKYAYGCFTLFLFSFLSFFTGIIYYEVDNTLLYHVNTSNSTCSEILSMDPNTTDTRLWDVCTFQDSRLFADKMSQIFILAISVLTELAFAAIHMESLAWQKTIKRIPEYETFVHSRSFPMYLFNSVLIFIQPYFFIQDLTFDYMGRKARINYLFLSIFLPIRTWHMVQFLIVSSYYHSPRAQRLGKMFGGDINIAFALKCLVKTSPHYVLIIALLSEVFLGGYLIRIWERFGNEEFDDYSNCIWYSFITMSTVGYGDYHTTTPLGKLVTTIVAFCGIFIASVVTVVLTDIFTFKGGQLKAYNMLNQIQMQNEIDNLTKRLANYCALFYKFNKERLRVSTGRNKNLQQAAYCEKQMRKMEKYKRNLINQLHQLNNDIKNSLELDYIDMITDRLSDVSKNVSKIKDTIGSFVTVMDGSNENQRNLEALKNTIFSNADEDEM